MGQCLNTVFALTDVSENPLCILYIQGNVPFNRNVLF